MEHLIRRFTGSGRLQGYTFPVGGKSETIDACLRAIEADAVERGAPLKYCLLTEEQANYLYEYYGKRAQFTCDNGDADYLYKRENLADLPGTLYHKKRNHISRFLRTCPTARFEALTQENAKDALWVAEQWLHAQEDNAGLEHEFRAINHAINQMEILQLCGGIVYVEQQPVSMAIASLINPRVADIHYEKCIPAMRDAYPYINRELARYLDVDFINREEDLNMEGLRQAKLSYHPDLILKKMKAEIYVN